MGEFHKENRVKLCTLGNIMVTVCCLYGILCKFTLAFLGEMCIMDFCKRDL